MAVELTAAVAKLVTNPASKPPVISGTTMRVNVRSLPAPRFSGRLFQADVQLLQRRGGGAQRIGQAAHRIGDDEHEPEGRERLAGEGQLHVEAGVQQADAEHEAGNRDRRHRDLLDQAAAGQARAQHDVGERRAQDHVDEAGKSAIEDRVGDHADLNTVV